jgi:hypothetical protein
MYIKVCKITEDLTVVVEKKDGEIKERVVRTSLLNKTNSSSYSDDKEIENYKKGL